MSLVQNKNTRALILIMCALVLSGITVSHYYYKNINESVDPRILDARTLYEKYNSFTQQNDFDSIFYLMDTIESIYSSVDHYKNSYEIGVLYNNRAASYLISALHNEEIDSAVQDSLVNLAEVASQRSIEIYDRWLEKFQNRNAEEIESIISHDFFPGLEKYYETDKYLKNRIREIQKSQIETKRRLSVSYTNLGIVYRHQKLYESAAICYKKAIDLWDRNLSAENNLNTLLNRPIKKRSFIQKLFPPDRNEN